MNDTMLLFRMNVDDKPGTEAVVFNPKENTITVDGTHTFNMYTDKTGTYKTSIQYPLDGGPKTYQFDITISGDGNRATVTESIYDAANPFSDIHHTYKKNGVISTTTTTYEAE